MNNDSKLKYGITYKFLTKCYTDLNLLLKEEDKRNFYESSGWNRPIN